MSGQHTPAPWSFSAWHIEEGPPAVRAPAGHIVATTASDDDAAFIVEAVNSYDRHRSTINALVAALERAKVLCALVTVRQAISAGNDAIEASGLNPWAMNEGLADGTERINTHFIDAALLASKEGSDV